VSKDEAKPAADGDKPKKSKLGLIIGIVAGVIVFGGGLVGGLVFGPKLMGPQDAAHAAPSATASHAASPEPLKILSATFEPIIIDIRGGRGELHHLKVGIAAELRDGVTLDDFKLVIPRGTEAALIYLRTLTLSEVTDPKEYKRIREELGERVTEAVGPDRVHRILLVEFVAQ
jgi:flagellar basal body-associated protein FliL